MESDKTDNFGSFAAPESGSAVLDNESLLLGKYRIVSLLGVGGMGRVYRVTLDNDATQFALKTLESANISEKSIRRFQVEAQAASLLDHPNLVQVHDYGVLENGRPFMVMDLVDGITLSEHLKQNGRLTVKQAVSIFSQACLALSYAHSQGVVHRDLKPSNIMLAADGNFDKEGSVRIVDFGIAKLITAVQSDQQSLTCTGEVFGSPLYMSPEQCMGSKIDYRTDIYSLGCVLYEALTGAPPHIGQSALSTMMLHQTGNVPSLKEASMGNEFPMALEAIVARMLAKRPDSRYQNVGGIAHQLQSVERTGVIADTQGAFESFGSLAKTWQVSTSMAVALLISCALLTFHLGGKHPLLKEPKNAPLSHVEKTPQTPQIHQFPASETELLDGFESMKVEKIPSPRAISKFLQSDAPPKLRRVKLPTQGVGSVWIAGLADKHAGLVADARGEILLPADNLLLRLDYKTMTDPVALKTIPRDVFIGVIMPQQYIERLNKSQVVRILEIISHWSSLKSISLRGCPLDREIADALKKLPNLAFIEIGNTNHIDVAALEEGRILKRLTGMAVFESQCDNLLQRVETSTNLRLLGMYDVSASSKTLQKVAACRHLSLFSCVDRSHLLDTGIFHSVAANDSIRSVSFAHITDAQMNILRRAPKIQTILLHGYGNQAERDRLRGLDSRIVFTD